MNGQGTLTAAHRAGLKSGPKVDIFFRQHEAEKVSNSRKKNSPNLGPTFLPTSVLGACLVMVFAREQYEMREKGGTDFTQAQMSLKVKVIRPDWTKG